MSFNFSFPNAANNVESRMQKTEKQPTSAKLNANLVLIMSSF